MYQVEFLDHEAFDALPYPDMETSLGVADPKTMKAFVRKTGVKAVDLFNAAHELEHLEDGHAGTHADHYRNGVYYKDFGQFLQASIPGTKAFQQAMPMMGDMLGSMFGMPGVGSAAKNIFDPQKPQQQTGLMDQFQGMPQIQDVGSQASQPNVIQTGGGSAGGGMGGPSGGGGLDQIGNQMYGTYSGKQPNIYNQNGAGTPVGGAA